MAIIAAALFLFWCRDYLILRMGPPHKISSRVALYSAVILVTTVLLSILAWREGLPAVSGFLRSFPILATLIAIHIGGVIFCFWLKRSDRYHRIWLVALIPAPAVWFFLANGMMSGESVAHGFVAWLFCGLWITAMVAMIARVRRIQMCAEDLDFAVTFAGSSNFLGSFILAFSPLLFQQIA